jgi:hypothetical protein
MRRARPAWSIGLFFLILTTGARPLRAAPPDGTNHIEEDWQVVIATPSQVEAGPQITTMMSPVGDTSKSFVAFNLNYRDAPFHPGGIQMQAWVANQLQASRASALHTEQLQVPGETISWTQVMQVSSGMVLCRIDNGNSTTWGAFGGWADPLFIGLTLGGNTFQTYNPDVSAQRSGVSWQANRVKSMSLVRVRYYQDDTLLSEDDNPRQVALGSP